jgi:hypothetical protein
MKDITFEAALDGFRGFLQSEGAPTNLCFIEAEDLVVTGRHATIRRPPAAVRFETARKTFEAAMGAGLGVEFLGLAGSGANLFCRIYRPTSREDALNRLILPEVKYGVRSPLLVAHWSVPVLWWLLRWRERSDPWARDWKKDTFGTGDTSSTPR